MPLLLMGGIFEWVKAEGYTIARGDAHTHAEGSFKYLADHLNDMPGK
jgi:hypothetical protein